MGAVHTLKHNGLSGADRQIVTNPCQNWPRTRNARQPISRRRAFTGWWFLSVEKKRAPPVGLEEGQQSSGKTTLPVNHCAPPGAQDPNPEQLAAMLRDLDRSELEQLLLTLLSKAESASE